MLLVCLQQVSGLWCASHRQTAAFLWDVAYKSIPKRRHTQTQAHRHTHVHCYVNASSGHHSILVSAEELWAKHQWIAISWLQESMAVKIKPCFQAQQEGGRCHRWPFLLPPLPFIISVSSKVWNFLWGWQQGNNSCLTADGERESESRGTIGIPVRAEDKIGAAVSGQNSWSSTGSSTDHVKGNQRALHSTVHTDKHRQVATPHCQQIAGLREPQLQLGTNT